MQANEKMLINQQQTFSRFSHQQQHRRAKNLDTNQQMQHHTSFQESNTNKGNEDFSGNNQRSHGGSHNKNWRSKRNHQQQTVGRKANNNNQGHNLSQTKSENSFPGCKTPLMFTASNESIANDENKKSHNNALNVSTNSLPSYTTVKTFKEMNQVNSMTSNYKNNNSWMKSNGYNALNLHEYHAQQPIAFNTHPMVKSFSQNFNSTYSYEYYLKRLHSSDRLDNPPNLHCQSAWDGVSEQIWNKYMMFRQSNTTYAHKIKVWSELFEFLREFPLFQYRACPNWSLHLVGSTISGFGLDTSDVDMCLSFKAAPHFDPRSEAVGTLNTIKNYLLSTGSSFRNFFLINAKVPILRFRDSTDTIEVDLNYNNCIGVRNTHLLCWYAKLDWRVRPLVIVAKLWAQHHNLNDARNGTISSYSLVLMVIHYLQSATKPCVLPCMHLLRPDKFNVLHDISTIDVLEDLDIVWKSDNNRPLGELFLRFLDYYSNFDYARNAISIRTGGTLSIEKCKAVQTPKNDPSHWQALCIEEPFDLTNTARSTYDRDVLAKIKNAFFQSWRCLKETKDLNALFQEPLFIKQQIPHHHYLAYMNTAAMQEMKFVFIESRDHSVNESSIDSETSNLSNGNQANPAVEFALNYPELKNHYP